MQTFLLQPLFNVQIFGLGMNVSSVAVSSCITVRDSAKDKHYIWEMCWQVSRYSCSFIRQTKIDI